MPKILQMITNIELDQYFTVYVLLQTFNKINASLQNADDADGQHMIPICLPCYAGDTKSQEKSPGSAQSQTAALPRHQEEEEMDKTKKAQNKQTYKKH